MILMVMPFFCMIKIDVLYGDQSMTYRTENQNPILDGLSVLNAHRRVNQAM